MIAQVKQMGEPGMEEAKYHEYLAPILNGVVVTQQHTRSAPAGFSAFVISCQACSE
jgi:hypothetical protein